MYRQKSVIFTIGKTLYIVKTLQSGQDIKEKKGYYIAIYKKNTYNNAYI